MVLRTHRPTKNPPPIVPKAEKSFVNNISANIVEPKKIKEEDKNKYIPETDIELIKQDGEKYVTITINNKILHYLFIGLGKYKEGFQGDSDIDKTERDNTNLVIDQLNEVKDILTEEKQPKKISDNDKDKVKII